MHRRWQPPGATRGGGAAPAPTLATLALALAVILAWAWPSTARAEAPSPELMARMTAFADTFEAMRTRGSVTIDGRLEVCDGGDKVQSVTTMSVRAEGQAGHTKFAVLHYAEDGVDKTAEAQRRPPRPPGAVRSSRDAKPLRIPILARDQALYTFDVVEVDRADPARLRIAFVPKRRADDTIEGSAWVDSRTGALISVAFKLDKTPTFVDFIHVTVEFGVPTSLGPAISNVRIDGAGGFLFFRKRFHGTATFSDYRIASAP